MLRDLKLRYGSSVLGYAWTIFEPALLTAVYYVVFSLLGRFGIEDYALFLMLGLLPWLWFNGVAIAGSRSLINQSALLQQVFMPRELPPLSVVFAKGVEYVASIPVLIVLALILRRFPDWRIFWTLPVSLLLLVMTCIGTACLLSAANVLLRDVERLLRVIMRALFYLSPILYPLATASDSFGSWAKYAYAINPLTAPLELIRLPFYPDLYPGWKPIVASGTVAFVALLIGVLAFWRLESQVLKEL